MQKEEIIQSILDGLVPQSTKDAVSSGVDHAIELGKSQGTGGGPTEEEIQARIDTAVQVAVEAVKAECAQALADDEAKDAEVIAGLQAEVQAAKDELVKQLAEDEVRDQELLAAVKAEDEVKLQAAIDAGVGAAQKFKDKSEELKELLNKLISL